MLQHGERCVILSFDTESDIGSWTQDYTSIDHAMPRLLDLLDKHDIRATFFWEGRAALHRQDLLAETARRGHECGCHGYQHETFGRPSYFIPGDRAILPEEVPHRIARNRRLVEEATGVLPTAFRAPRLWGDEVLIRALAETGFLVDSTYPIHRDDDVIFPYRPDSSSMGRRGDLPLLEFPVAGLAPGLLAGLVDEEMKRNAVRSAEGDGALSLGQWPLLRLYGAERFQRYCEVLAERQLSERGIALLSIYQHPWEYLAMPCEISGPEAVCRLADTLWVGTGNAALEGLDIWIGLMKRDGWRFRTCAETASQWLATESEASQWNG